MLSELTSAVLILFLAARAAASAFAGRFLGAAFDMPKCRCNAICLWCTVFTIDTLSFYECSSETNLMCAAQHGMLRLRISSGRV